MQWEKLGRIFEPCGQRWWTRTHAADPIARWREGNLFRIYCTGRDERSRGHVGWFEIDLTHPFDVIRICDDPVIVPGELGGFDDNGVVSACIVDLKDGIEHHYFSGMAIGVTVPFYFYVGLGISRDRGNSVQKWTRSPILDRNAVDPYLTGSPWVIRDGKLFRMWYTSGVRWSVELGVPKHYYHIKYAESDNGIAWRRRGIVAIDFLGAEHVTARPCVLLDSDLYRMWYSYRGDSYRIGYAESEDGIRWSRMDSHVGIDVSNDGWDCEMIEYATVFDHAGERYMLYNGNGYGRSGIGLARLVSES